MKIFCDTNIIIELLEVRKEYLHVKEILKHTDYDFYLSEGSLYTIAYLADRYVRSKGLSNPQRTHEVKRLLLGILQKFNIVETGKDGFHRCLTGSDFTDIEDGFQYQAALACGADVLLTINDKDFQDADPTIVNVMTPSQFAEQFL